MIPIQISKVKVSRPVEGKLFFQRGFSLIKALCFEAVFLFKMVSRRPLPKPALKVAKIMWKGDPKLFQLL